MKITAIESEHNQLLSRIKSLHLRSNRKKSGLFLIEGSKVLAEAVKHHVCIQDILVSQSFLEAGLTDVHHLNLASIHVVDDRKFSHLTTTDGPCGIIAVAKIVRFDEHDIFAGPAPLVVVADAIQDPGNLGTMIRTALAANVTGMILTKGTVDLFNPKVVRASAGALFCLPILVEVPSEQALALVKNHQVNIVACHAHCQKQFWEVDFTGPTAMVVGNEGQGLGPLILEKADEVVQIPMNNATESLNVAIATAIVLFGVVQQRLTKLKL